jgi:hypothetical protein
MSDRIADRPTDVEVALAKDWHGGQTSMLYAVASRGVLELGTVRPAHCFSDDEWKNDLRWLLATELANVYALANKRSDWVDATTARLWGERLGYRFGVGDEEE